MSHLKLSTLFVLLAATAGAWAQLPADFEPYTAYNLNQDAQTVAIGDLNGDGKNDVAVTALPSTLFVFYQQSDGTLSSPAIKTAPSRPVGLAVDDLNGDGRNDVMIGGTGGLISLYYQQQDGSLGVPVNCSAYGATSGIVTGDFNSDGLKDFAASTASYGGLFVFNQDPTGGYGLADYYILSGATSGSSITRLDYNSDSKDDIALIVPHRLCYLTQNAEGKLDTPAYLPSPWAYGLAAGDVTGDGLDDLVYTVDDYQPYSLIGVYAQDAAGVPALLDTYPVMDKPKSLALADVDGDQRTDVITVYEGLESLIVNNQNPEGKLGLGQSYQIPYSDTYQPKALAVGDINSDGFSDIALASGMNGLVVLRHTGNGDDTPPVVTLQPSVTVIWPPTGETVNIPVNVGGSDEGSGLANLHLKVVDEYGLVQPEMDVTPGQIAVPLVAFRNDGDMDGRVYTLILTGIDNAGNTASVQSTVTVPHSNPKNDKPDKPKPPKKNKP